MRKTISMLLILGTSVIFANEAFSSIGYQQCMSSSRGVTIDMNTCNTQELRLQDKLLNQNYKNAIRRLTPNKRKQLKIVQRQ